MQRSQDEEVSENKDSNMELGAGGTAEDAARTAAVEREDPFGAYDLVATMVHSGTTHGGHYRAFIRGDRAEIVTNGSTLTTVCVKVGQRQVRTMFGRILLQACQRRPKGSSDKEANAPIDGDREANISEKTNGATRSKSKKRIASPMSPKLLQQLHAHLPEKGEL